LRKQAHEPLSDLWRFADRIVEPIAVVSIRSKSTREKKYDEDDNDDPDETDAAVPVAVAVAAEAATEAAKQEDHQDDDEDKSDRHNLSPIAEPARKKPTAHPHCPVSRVGAVANIEYPLYEVSTPPALSAACNRLGHVKAIRTVKV
jgi:hypothetical protein